MGPMIGLAAPILVPMSEGIGRGSLGAVLLELGLLKEAEEQLSLASAKTGPLAGITSSSLESRWGDLRRSQWRLEEATAHYEKALVAVGDFVLLPFVKDGRMEVRALSRLAEIAMLSNRVDHALAWSDRALERVRVDEDRGREAALLESHGEYLQRAHRVGPALKNFREALRIATEIKDQYRVATVTAALGRLAKFRGDQREAIHQLSKAADLFASLDAPLAQAAAWNAVAQSYLMLGDEKTARTLLRRSRQVAASAELAMMGHLTEVTKQWADLVSGSGSTEKVLAAWDALWSMPQARALGLGSEMDVFFKKLIRMVGVEGESAPAQEAQEALARVSHLLPQLSALATVVEGKLELEEGHLERALRIWSQAVEQFTAEGNEDLEVRPETRSIKDRSRLLFSTGWQS